MENKTERKVVCLFCGKERSAYDWENDGVDYYGHARGHYRKWTVDEGCSCSLGEIEHTKQHITHMCLNCKSYKGGYCTNEESLNSITQMFDVGTKLEVKKPTRKCQFWEINYEVFSALLLNSK